jgi:hypothetical protein
VSYRGRLRAALTFLEILAYANYYRDLRHTECERDPARYVTIAPGRWASMNTKPKINPGSTYVLNETDIEQLDELSLTSMVTALVETIPQDDPAAAPIGVAAPSPAAETAINEIIKGLSEWADQPPELSDSPAEPDTAGDLIDPELIFLGLTPGRRR